MNKNLIFVVVLLLLVVGFYFIRDNFFGKKNVVLNEINPIEVSSTGNLKINESKVSYSVDKVFFNKPVEKIVGVTGDLNGDLNYENNIISAKLIIPTLNIATGQSKRDEDVRKLIGEEIKVEVKAQEITFPFENKMTLLVTVKDKTNEVLFDVVAKDENGVVSFSGKSKISMKSFGIEAPSMVEVYKASDEVDLSFELKAIK